MTRSEIVQGSGVARDYRGVDDGTGNNEKWRKAERENSRKRRGGEEEERAAGDGRTDDGSTRRGMDEMTAGYILLREGGEERGERRGQQ